MRIHDEADRLVGDELLRFGDVGERARLGLGGLEDHDVVLELHKHRVVTAGSSGQRGARCSRRICSRMSASANMAIHTNKINV